MQGELKIQMEEKNSDNLSSSSWRNVLLAARLLILGSFGCYYNLIKRSFYCATSRTFSRIFLSVIDIYIITRLVFKVLKTDLPFRIEILPARRATFKVRIVTRYVCILGFNITGVSTIYECIN